MRSMFSRLLVGSAALVLGSSSIASAAPGVFRTANNDVIVVEAGNPGDELAAISTPKTKVRTGTADACGLIRVPYYMTSWEKPQSYRVGPVASGLPAASINATTAGFTSLVAPGCSVVNGVATLSTPVTGMSYTMDDRMLIPQSVSGVAPGQPFILEETSRTRRTGKVNSCGFAVFKSKNTPATNSGSVYNSTQEFSVPGGAATIGALAVKSNVPFCQKSKTPGGPSVTFIPLPW